MALLWNDGKVEGIGVIVSAGHGILNFKCSLCTTTLWYVFRSNAVRCPVDQPDGCLPS